MTLDERVRQAVRTMHWANRLAAHFRAKARRADGADPESWPAAFSPTNLLARLSNRAATVVRSALVRYRGLMERDGSEDRA